MAKYNDSYIYGKCTKGKTIDLDVIYTGCKSKCYGSDIKPGMTLREVLIILLSKCDEPEKEIIWGQIIGDIEDQTDLVEFIQQQISTIPVDFLVFDTIEDLRNASTSQINKIKDGTVKGVTVLGYYEKGDTPSPINYYLSDTTRLDDGGSIIIVRDIKLYHNFKGEVQLIYFGLSINRSGIQNKISLGQAVLSGNKDIVVDNFYPISGAAPILNLPQEITIRGKDEYCGFNVVQGGVLFYTNQNGISIDILNIRIIWDYEATGVFRLLQLDEGWYTESINIKNSYFNGFVQVLRAIGSNILNPNTNLFGIKNINISNNIATNIKGAFTYIDNCPCISEIVENNNVINLAGSFFRSMLANNSTNKDLIRDKRVSCVISNNKVYNEDGFFPASPINGTYMSFAVTEGKNIIYRNNNVEGLKVNGYAPVYDGYFSNTNVICENNIWKNNLSFDPNDTTHNFLVKAKGAGDVDEGVVRQRIYRGNTYIVEPQWLERIGKTKYQAWNNFYELAYDADFVFENNYVSLMGIVGDSKANVVNSVSIKNNTFIFEYIKFGSSALFWFIHSNVNNTPSYIESNSITIKETVVSGRNLYLFASTVGMPWATPISIKNIEIDSANSLYSIFASLDASNIDIQNINVRGDIFTMFYNCNFIKSNLTQLRYDSSIASRSPYMGQKFIYDEGYLNMTSVGITESIRIPVSTVILSDDLSYRVTITITQGVFTKQLVFYYYVYSDDSDIRIRYRNQSNAQVDRIVGNTGTNENMFSISTGNLSSNIYPSYRIGALPFIQIIGVPTGRTVKQIEIEITKSPDLSTATAIPISSIGSLQSYTTANRPVLANGENRSIIDSTINKPIWGTGTSGATTWVDATGQIV